MRTILCVLIVLDREGSIWGKLLVDEERPPMGRPAVGVAACTTLAYRGDRLWTRWSCEMAPRVNARHLWTKSMPTRRGRRLW
ncbi:hypothetical protein BHE74_00048932 [Ensete ventricosum]|nr:hypothetical protein BHE74_00048932 [Ensete ventricosum]RZS21816.1 hypothetical protein BHM03_00054497 [Ensete ventricosum]